jgi:hypothetical protein
MAPTFLPISPDLAADQAAQAAFAFEAMGKPFFRCKRWCKISLAIEKSMGLEGLKAIMASVIRCLRFHQIFIIKIPEVYKIIPPLI